MSLTVNKINAAINAADIGVQLVRVGKRFAFQGNATGHAFPCGIARIGDCDVDAWLKAARDAMLVEDAHIAPPAEDVPSCTFVGTREQLDAVEHAAGIAEVQRAIREHNYAVSVFRLDGGGIQLRNDNTGEVREYIKFETIFSASLTFWVKQASYLARSTKHTRRLSDMDVKKAASLIQLKQRSAKTGMYVWVQMLDCGDMHARMADTLQPAFNAMNSGQRIFIRDADINRYSRELAKGMHK